MRFARDFWRTGASARRMGLHHLHNAEAPPAAWGILLPVEAKPLFRPDVLRPYLTRFQLPQRVEQSREKLAHWAHLLSSGKADACKNCFRTS